MLLLFILYGLNKFNHIYIALVFTLQIEQVHIDITRGFKSFSFPFLYLKD